MKKILGLGKEFIYGGHLLSLGFSAIIYTVVIFLKLPVSLTFLAIPYLISQFIYSYNHLKEIHFDADSNPERASHIKQREHFTRFLLAAYLILLAVCLLTTNLLTTMLALTILIGGILYTDVFKELGIKYIVGFKNLYTSFFVAVGVFLIPTFYQLEISLFLIGIALFVFIRLIVNTVFFDIKDLESDKSRGLKTFPVMMGKKKTIIVLQLINLVSLIPIIGGIITDKQPSTYFLLIGLMLYAFYYLTHAIFLNGKGLRNLSYIVVDGEYVFWPLLVLLARG